MDPVTQTQYSQASYPLGYNTDACNFQVVAGPVLQTYAAPNSMTPSFPLQTPPVILNPCSYVVPFPYQQVPLCHHNVPVPYTPAYYYEQCLNPCSAVQNNFGQNLTLYTVDDVQMCDQHTPHSEPDGWSDQDSGDSIEPVRVTRELVYETRNVTLKEDELKEALEKHYQGMCDAFFEACARCNINVRWTELDFVLKTLAGGKTTCLQIWAGCPEAVKTLKVLELKSLREVFDEHFICVLGKINDKDCFDNTKLHGGRQLAVTEAGWETALKLKKVLNEHLGHRGRSRVEEFCKIPLVDRFQERQKIFRLCNHEKGKALRGEDVFFFRVKSLDHLLEVPKLVEEIVSEVELTSASVVTSMEKEKQKAKGISIYLRAVDRDNLEKISDILCRFNERRRFDERLVTNLVGGIAYDKETKR